MRDHPLDLSQTNSIDMFLPNEGLNTQYKTLYSSSVSNSAMEPGACQAGIQNSITTDGLATAVYTICCMILFVSEISETKRLLFRFAVSKTMGI